jgi:hypothetical protein
MKANASSPTQPILNGKPGEGQTEDYQAENRQWHRRENHAHSAHQYSEAGNGKKKKFP